MTLHSRRSFLTTGLLSTTGLALAGSSLTRRLTAAQQQQVRGANERLRVAVVGVNGRGMAHVHGFGDLPNCEIAAIVDVDENVGRIKAEVIGKRYNKVPTVYTDLRKCYEDQSIDIVGIATPNHWHALAAIWAIQAGKDVYTEKPVSHNVSEGRRIVEAARKYSRIVQTGTQSRSNPGMREAIAFLHSGGIGVVKLARGLCYKTRNSIGPRGNYDVPASVNYELWSGPVGKKPLTRPQFHYDWHWQWDYGNGDLGNQGIHQMDIARWGLGEKDLGLTVLSYGGRFGYEDAGETPNTQVCQHDFSDGKRLIFEVRGLKSDSYKGASVGVVFQGTEGSMVVPSYSGGIVYNNDGKKVKEFAGGEDRHHFENFVRAVRERNHELLNADILEGHLSSALCHIGNISYRLGQPGNVDELGQRLRGDDVALETRDRFLQHLKDNKVDLNQATINVGPVLTLGEHESFVGEQATAANQFLTREYVPPFVVPKTEDL